MKRMMFTLFGLFTLATSTTAGEIDCTKLAQGRQTKAANCSVLKDDGARAKCEAQNATTAGDAAIGQQAK